MNLLNVEPDTGEKVERLSDVLVDFGHLPLLNRCLSLYGGTALNFLHLSDVPRLSEDLDYNYRHSGERDWGEVRTEIDVLIKTVLDKLGYSPEDIKIQSLYNLMRFHVHYTSRMGKRDAIKIEIGYTRRMPVMDSDEPLPYEHPTRGLMTRVLTPRRVELFANKICTLISRGLGGQYPRDIFDVSMIAERELDHDEVTDVVMIEGLLSEIDITDCELKRPDRSLYYGLSRLLTRRYDLDEVFERANEYLGKMIEELKRRGWPDFRQEFMDSGKVNLNYLKDPARINPDIESHPLLLWIREKKTG